MKSNTASSHPGKSLLSARTIPDGVSIGHVHLKVADLDRAIAFYSEGLGFEVTQRLGREAAFLSAGGYHHHIGLNTWSSRGGQPPTPGTTGLFHAAILYPTRADLADALRRILANGIRIDGASDHGVSEAIYLRDPDGNGLELYWDRPREDWPRNRDGTLDLFTEPLDLESLLAEPGASKARTITLHQRNERMITMKTKSTHTVSSVADATGGIWCGTDFTPASEVAVDVATDFARRLDTPLTLAHVFEMPRALRGDAKASRWLQASRKRTLRETADASRKRGVAVTESVSSGRMAETIIQKAAAEKAQLIVVPSANGRRLNKWIPHSGAKRTPGRADSPMLVVRKAEPLRVWLRGKKPLKIFVAFDFTASAEAALRWAKTLTAIGPCEVVLGYINNAVDDHIRVGTAGRIPFGGNPPEVLAILERDMKKRSGDLLGSSTVRCRIEDHTGSVEDRLMAMAAEEDADLIIVGSRKRSRWQRLVNPSVSRRLLRGVGTNLAIVPFVPEKMSPDKLPMVRHVLVATDLSEVGNTAIPHAYSLVKGGGIVTLLHVVTPPVSPVLADRFPGSLPLVHDEVNAAEAAKVAAKLRSLVPSGTSALGVNTQVKVISNRQAGLAIAQAAERLGVDVVCIASRERSELRKLMFGSVAVEVISRVRRPVFVVRAPAC